MVNQKIESMEIQKTGLLAQNRQLDGESYDLLLQIRVREDALQKALEFEKWRTYRAKGHSKGFPQNMGRDHIKPIEAELNDLKTRRAIVLERLAKIKKEINDLGALVDRCRRHAGYARPTIGMLPGVFSGPGRV